MTNDQKQVLKGFLMFFAFKALLYFAINRAAKAAREMTREYESGPDLKGQFGIKTGTDVLGGHAKVNFKR